ncbi:MAG: type VI secretion system-associated FHA domain protein TagH [Pseudomonadota bacterium]
MTLTLRIEGSGAVPGGTDSVTMQGEALTIGRAPGNDLVLPDPERVVSSRHCVLEARGGDYLLIDISTNGTFVNYASEAVGPTPTPINNGDVIGVGRYELRVEIVGQSVAQADPFSNLPPPAEAPPLVGQRPPPGGVFGDPGALTSSPGAIGTDFIDELLGGEAPGVGRRAETRADPRPEDLLPPDLTDDPFAPAAEEPVPGESLANHNPSTQDHFAPPPVRRDLIPDDWDLGPNPELGSASDAPFLQPPAAGAPSPWPNPQPDGVEARPWDVSRPVGPEPDPRRVQNSGPPQAPPHSLRPGQPAPQAPPVPSPPAPAAQQAPVASVASVAETAPVAETDPASTISPAAPTSSSAGSVSSAAPADRAAAARAFLREAGVAQDTLGDDELEEVMARLGETFRILIGGLREVLIARAAIKNEFRLTQTVISVDGNNPLKFSVSTEHAMESMVKPATPGYQSAPVAAREAIDDIKAHEVAMMTGMQAAIDGLLKRFDPEKLSGRIESSALTSLLSNRKARLWDHFELLYGDIAREAEDDFQTLFGREFARAYQAQLRKL